MHDGPSRSRVAYILSPARVRCPHCRGPVAPSGNPEVGARRLAASDSGALPLSSREVREHSPETDNCRTIRAGLAAPGTSQLNGTAANARVRQTRNTAAQLALRIHSNVGIVPSPEF